MRRRPLRAYLVEYRLPGGELGDLTMWGQSVEDVATRFRRGWRGVQPPRRFFGPKPFPAELSRVFPVPFV